jgi:CRISPR/Cas system-associated exonuclease Cas4 (RecB family)
MKELIAYIGVAFLEDPKELLLHVLHSKDASRDRSTQTEVGPSEIGGCRRKVWYRLNAQPHTNENQSKLAAIMGTAIHAAIEDAIGAIDPEGKEYLVETEVAFGDMKAHVDLFVPSTGAVIDWKTSKVKNMSYFPSNQQRWQVQIYGYLLSKNGYEVKTVNLVAIARDGNEKDVKVHTEPYDEVMALAALAWLENVKASKELPAPEKDASFCKDYCQYYDATEQMGCGGLKKERIVLSEVVIEDEEVDKHALHYLQLDQKIKELEKERDSFKASLEGATGTTKSGIEISWITVKGRETVDAKEVEKLLGFVPKVVGNESVRLNIKTIGGK